MDEKVASELMEYISREETGSDHMEVQKEVEVEGKGKEKEEGINNKEKESNIV